MTALSPGSFSLSVDAASEQLKKIKLLLLDVDGVLTEGEIIYNDHGSETKVFNVKDGVGIRLLLDAGIRVGIVTGRRCEALRHRCRNLGLDLLFDAVHDKSAVLETILAETGLTATETAFMGDDLPDIPLMNRVGLAVAVADAAAAVCARADITTAAGGGRGAVREICEAILKAQNLWPEVLQRFGADAG